MTTLNSSHLQRRFKENSGASSKHFHEHKKSLHAKLNTTPQISYALASTPLGLMMMAATDRGICFLQFGESAEVLQKTLKEEFKDSIQLKPIDSQQVPFKSWFKIVNSYLSGESKKLNLPLDVQGTEFQQRVWNYLQKVPAGKTMSYMDLALALGKKSAVRAVASACAKNKIALVIPCHRIVRGNGHLAGYRWGLEKKRHLLDLEK